MGNVPSKFRVRNQLEFLSIVAVAAILCLTRAIAQEPTARPKIIHTFAPDKFYDTADPLPAGKPGELIRSAEFDRYELPGNVSAVRILYHSLSANNDDVPASGVVLFPDKNPPTGGWPIIAWAHDLNGVARTCAPSLARNLRSGSFLSMYVQLGYAIVASDYAGLGSNGRSAAADMNSNAIDVINAITAARKAVPQLGVRWVAMGTGEGSLTAVALADHESQMHDAEYLGSIAIGSLRDMQQEFDPVKDVSARALLSLVYGVQTVYPKFQPSEILNPAGISLYNHFGSDCEKDAAVSSAPAELMKSNWESNGFVRSYFSRNRLGGAAIQAPLLILSSDADSHFVETKKVVSRLCSAGDKLQFDTYPGSDPAALIGDSVRDQIQWMESVFANKTPHNDCSSQR